MEQQRYIFLDGLRGLAALTIVVHHFTLDAGHGEVFASASVAVDFFFCLSGFVIAHAYHSRLLAGMPLRQYIAKRLARLYPMYLVGTLIGLVGIILLQERGLTSLTRGQVAQAFVLNLFYVPMPNWEWVQVFSLRIRGTIFPLNHPAWSLFFGMVANLSYAASLRVSQRAPLLIACASAVVLFLASSMYGEAPGWGIRNVEAGFPRVFFAFFAGVVICQHYRLVERLPRLPPALVAGCVALLLAVPQFPEHGAYWLFAAIVIMPLAVAVGSRCVVAPGSRAERLCTYAGNLSYPIFCIHYPLLFLFSLLPRDDGKMTLLSLTFVDFAALSMAFFFTTIAVAHVLMTRLEKPMREWLESFGARLTLTRP